MERRLINRLLKLVQSEESRVQATAMLKGFSKTYGLGCLVGTQIEFSEKDKALIKSLLIQGEGVDPDKVKAGQFNDLTRAEASKLGSNEKLTTRPVREDRIAVKALPAQALLLGIERLTLPDGSSLDVNWQWLLDNCQHRSIMAVENWEAFENIHKINFDITQYADNPLVIFRGGDEYNQKWVMSLLEAMQVPVFYFGDFDPAGLGIAQSLPCFGKLIAPPDDQLLAALKQCKNHERYQKQLGTWQITLNNSNHPDILKYWPLIREHGVGLPQEYFIETNR
ncbi:DUF7281 domain-containing protein [Leucothrix mucor]|uniref:DUF7281 domain-containing protein n=1 Tax=Leucothrix mucor TaxID=45248 RepID=UPI0003B3EFCD|nr:DUF2399 domain-containing protein [Leucothrix mucor]